MRLTRENNNKYEKEFYEDVEIKYIVREEKDICNSINKLGQLEDVLEKYNLDTPQDLDMDLKYCHKFVYEYGQIEEELGIDLITYIKLVQNGFYGICEDDEHDKPYVFEFLPRDFVAYSDEIVVYWQGSEEEYCSYQYKDLGKTWSLNKEDLV